MKIKTQKLPIVISIVLFCLSFTIEAQSIVTTKHNLSVSGLGSVKATTLSEICIFCHTPHSSSPRSPLWNKSDNGSIYTLYDSSTLNALPGQPDGSSILCLSCHDGTIALGDVMSLPTPIIMTSGINPTYNITTDLSNDHPISFVYDAALATSDGQLKTPPLLNDVLDKNSKMQCTSCHNPHSTNPKFLSITNEYSEMCFSCHDRNYWSNSSHNTSYKTWDNTGTNPWMHLENAFSTVAQNACVNCHDPHNANGKSRLLKYAAEEDNCFDCHNGNVASKNVQADFVKTYRHNIYAYTGIHDPKESANVASRHVECQDCHNPHAANATTAIPPFVNGYNLGVSGVNQSGNVVETAAYAYEICYKCHSGNSWSPSPAITRQINQNNVRLEFSTGNPSFHPIVGARNNTEISPNLITPNTASTVLYCTSCHASNNPTGPKGPHGSIYPQILKYNYVTTDNTSESSLSYELCYSCHNRNNIINDNFTFKEHKKHIVKENTPCSVCHDPHGISSTQGNIVNNSNLINFRTGIVTPSSSGRLRFEDTGMGSGRCYLTCHGKDHDPKKY